MNAQEARQVSLSVTSESVKAQIQEIYGKIKSCCDRGDLNCTFFGNLLQGTIKQLTADGYNLEKKEDNDRMQSITYYEISW